MHQITQYVSLGPLVFICCFTQWNLNVHRNIVRNPKMKKIRDTVKGRKLLLLLVASYKNKI